MVMWLLSSGGRIWCQVLTSCLPDPHLPTYLPINQSSTYRSSVYSFVNLSTYLSIIYELSMSVYLSVSLSLSLSHLLIISLCVVVSYF